MKRILIGTITRVALLSLFFTAWLPADEEKKEGDMQEVAVIETRFGEIVLEFFPDVAPKHVENFKKLASEGFYDGSTFHRVIPGFVIQGGDPNSKDDDRNNDGTGGPGYMIDAEFNERNHLRGTLSMARSSDPNSAGSQFFICVKPQPARDGKYTVFGQVIEGMYAVDKIVSVKRDPRDNPIEPVPMEKVRIEERKK
jgi:peptidyl-prolyl cis-trans isomerase B (cyclophilin B)